MFRNLMKQF